MWAMVGDSTGEILSYGGAMVIHDNRYELEFLCPGVRVVEVQGSTVDHVATVYGRPAMLLREHPDMASVRWPLDRRDFRS